MSARTARPRGLVEEWAPRPRLLVYPDPRYSLRYGNPCALVIGWIGGGLVVHGVMELERVGTETGGPAVIVLGTAVALLGLVLLVLPWRVPRGGVQPLLVVDAVGVSHPVTGTVPWWAVAGFSESRKGRILGGSWFVVQVNDAGLVHLARTRPHSKAIASNLRWTGGPIAIPRLALPRSPGQVAAAIERYRPPAPPAW